MLAHWRQPDVDALLSGLDGEASVSIRLNPARGAVAVEQIDGYDGRVPWCSDGVYLRERPLFTADPLLHAGAYYVQEASSMFLHHGLKHILASSGMMPAAALDLCAAPGGKSTLLRSLLPDSCLLVSNEVVRPRAQVLAENMAKWGVGNVVVTNASVATLADSCGSLVSADGFDVIVADVPCSGEGMFRKEEEALRQWTPQLVDDCAATARDIVSRIWPCLRRGGTLVFSTCTFNPFEDEDMVEWICRELGGETMAVPVADEWGIVGDMRAARQADDRLHCYHFLPGRVRGEGFFIAFVRKTEGEALIRKPALSYVDGPKQATSRANQRQRPARRQSSPSDALNILPVNQLDDPSAPKVDVSMEQAVRYLQHEAITLPADAPTGIVQVCFRGQRLGLAKNIGSRANNLYPKEWRIRSSHIQPHCILPQ